MRYLKGTVKGQYLRGQWDTMERVEMMGVAKEDKGGAPAF
jgi:hypothetical protein